MEPSELKVVRYEVADHVATVTLDRPHRMNAWTGRMHAEHRACLAWADADPDVRAVVVTGAGRRLLRRRRRHRAVGPRRGRRLRPGHP